MRWLDGITDSMDVSLSASPQVVFWCLNEESDFEAAFNLGATGVITDYPTALRCYLDSRGPPALAS